MSKGKRNERAVAKMLEQWWRHYEPESVFIKTPQSGGWGTAQTREVFRASGDVMTTSRTFPFSVEVKRREAWSEEHLLAGKKSPVWGWWNQSCKQAHEMKVEPMMFFKRNRKPWWIMIANTTESKLDDKGISLSDFEGLVVCRFNSIVIEPRLHEGDFFPMIVDAQKFFEYISPFKCVLRWY